MDPRRTLSSTRQRGRAEIRPRRRVELSAQGEIAREIPQPGANGCLDSAGRAGPLVLAEIELLQHVAAQRVAGEALAAVGAEIEAQLLIGILVLLARRLAAVQRFVNFRQVIPIVFPVFGL